MVAPRSRLLLRGLAKKVGGTATIIIGAVLLALALPLIPLALFVLATSPAFSVLLVLASIVLTLLGFFLIHFGKSFMTLRSEEVTAWDSRPPVLYLRSFADDGKDVPPDYTTPGYPMKYSYVMGGGRAALSHMESFEELIVRLFKKVGPVLAVSRPDQGLLPPGASRLVIVGEDNDWQSRVRDMIGRSRAVVLIAGKSPGLNWELQEVVKQGALDKAWIVFPPGDKAREERADPEPGASPPAGSGPSDQTQPTPTTRLQFVRAALTEARVELPPDLREAGLMLLRFGSGQGCRAVEATRNREEYERCIKEEMKAPAP